MLINILINILIVIICKYYIYNCKHCFTKIYELSISKT